MTAHAATLGRAVAAHWRRWLAVSVAFFVLYYAGLLLLTILRFREIPNYVEVYDVLGSYRLILHGTPAWADAWRILVDEPMLELGFKDPHYYGVATWSYMLIPPKMAAVLLAGALLATVVVLGHALKLASCPRSRRPSYAVAGVASGFIGLTSATLTWVACCATPSWVVGLTMLGMSSSLALWLEPLGTVLAVIGFTLLLGLVAWQLRRLVRATAPARGGGDVRIPVAAAMAVPDVIQRRGVAR